METKVVQITPKVAKKMLKQNKKNRALRDHTVLFYAEQMKNGQWQENGEAIIVDCNGVIKDGQHRLSAVIKADHTYNSVVVSGVHPNVMSTIDTGANRSLCDILELNDFKYPALMAAVVKRILKHEKGINALGHKGTMPMGSNKTSNSEGLEYASDNMSMLYLLIKETGSIYGKSTKAFAHSDLAFALYLFSHKGERINSTAIEYIKMIAGVVRIEGNAGDYIYTLKSRAKAHRTPLNPKWLKAILIKGWNSYFMGDPKVRYIRWKVEQPFPKLISV
jgi:hypothetical protein